MKKLNLVICFILSLCFISCTQKTTNMVILVDLTTFEKKPDSVIRELKDVEAELNNELQTNPKKYLGGSIGLGFINDRGENENLWKVSIPPLQGDDRSLLKMALKKIGSEFEGTYAQLKKEKGAYQQSWIVEPIVKELKRMKDEDKLYVISDLLVVDGENNFEKLKFGRPQDLSRYGAQKKLELRRISLGGLKVREIALLEAWWESSKSGDNTDYLAELSRFQKRTLGAPRVAYQKVERTSMPMDEDPRQ